MNEFMIRSRLDGLVDAMRRNDENAGLDHAMAIAGQIILDLHRVANALEAIAQKTGTPVTVWQPGAST